MAQVLQIHQKLTVQVVTEVVGDFIIKKWKRQGICLWQEHVFLDTSRQNWMGRNQPSQMPQQDSFHNNFQTALACGHYSVLSSMYAVRNWKLYFDLRMMFGQNGRRSCKSRILWHLQGLVHKMEASPQTAM